MWFCPLWVLVFAQQWCHYTSNSVGQTWISLYTSQHTVVTHTCTSLLLSRDHTPNMTLTKLCLAGVRSPAASSRWSTSNIPRYWWECSVLPLFWKMLTNKLPALDWPVPAHAHWYTHVHTYTHTTYTHTHMYTTYTHMHTHIHTHVHTPHTHTCTHTYTHMYTHHIHTHVHTHTHTERHTHIHTHWNTRMVGYDVMPLNAHTSGKSPQLTTFNDTMLLFAVMGDKKGNSNKYKRNNTKETTQREKEVAVMEDDTVLSWTFSHSSDISFLFWSLTHYISISSHTHTHTHTTQSYHSSLTTTSKDPTPHTSVYHTIHTYTPYTHIPCTHTHTYHVHTHTHTIDTQYFHLGPALQLHSSHDGRDACIAQTLKGTITFTSSSFTHQTTHTSNRIQQRLFRIGSHDWQMSCQ